MMEKESMCAADQAVDYSAHQINEILKKSRVSHPSDLCGVNSSKVISQYTTIPSLMKIINSESILCSHYKFLNDPREGNLLPLKIREILKKIFDLGALKSEKWKRIASKSQSQRDLNILIDLECHDENIFLKEIIDFCENLLKCNGFNIKYYVDRHVGLYYGDAELFSKSGIRSLILFQVLSSFQRMGFLLKEDFDSDEFNGAWTHPEKNDVKTMFISSFNIGNFEEESLDMWRAYGGDGSGVKIEFNPEIILSIATDGEHKNHCNFYKVNYFEEGGKDVFELSKEIIIRVALYSVYEIIHTAFAGGNFQIIEDFLGEYRAYISSKKVIKIIEDEEICIYHDGDLKPVNVFGEILNEIRIISFISKSISYKNENEIRLIVELNRDVDDWDFIEKDFSIRPVFFKKILMQNSFPINRIIVGPKCSHLDIVSIDLLIHKYKEMFEFNPEPWDGSYSLDDALPRDYYKCPEVVCSKIQYSGKP